MKALLVTCVLMLATSGSAQVNKSKIKSKSQAVTTQTAVTKDGRTVLLKSDGTWEYSADKTVQNAGSIEIKAALVYRSGDVKPVARAQFYLLDADLIAILRGAGLKAVGLEAESRGDNDDTLLFSYGLALKYPTNDDYVAFYPKATEAVKSHIKYTGISDFEGRLTFENIEAGSYFIFCHTVTQKGFVLWSLPVQIRDGKVQIILDQNNAKFAT